MKTPPRKPEVLSPKVLSQYPDYLSQAPQINPPPPQNANEEVILTNPVAAPVAAKNDKPPAEEDVVMNNKWVQPYNQQEPLDRLSELICSSNLETKSSFGLNYISGLGWCGFFVIIHVVQQHQSQPDNSRQKDKMQLRKW